MGLYPFYSVLRSGPLGVCAPRPTGPVPGNSFTTNKQFTSVASQFLNLAWSVCVISEWIRTSPDSKEWDCSISAAKSPWALWSCREPRYLTAPDSHSASIHPALARVPVSGLNVPPAKTGSGLRPYEINTKAFIALHSNTKKASPHNHGQLIVV